MSEITDHGTGERGKWFYNSEGKLQKRPPKRKAKPIHAVLQDTRLDPIECMCPNHETDESRWFDSMSAYKRHLKEGGWEISGKPTGSSKKATDRLNELVNDSTINEDFEKAKALIDNGMYPMSADERARLEAYSNEKQAQEREWKKRNWHRIP